MTTAVQLHLLMSVASNPQRPSGHEKPGRAGQHNKSLKARRCSVQLEMQFYVISINSMMHVAGLIGTVVPADEVSKWMYWIFGCAMFAMISNQLTSTQGQIWRVAKKNKVLDNFGALARTTIAVWALYPLMWAFADGSRTIKWEIKELLYMFLDLLAKFSFTLVFLVTCSRDVLPRACQVLHSNISCSGTLPNASCSSTRSRRGPRVPCTRFPDRAAGGCAM
jgi:bacteriorhodopsin